MTDLNDFFYVDGIQDVMAVYVNNLLAGNLRGELTNTETLSATKTLADASLPIQNLAPSGSNQTVLLPAEAITNHNFVIKNSGATYDLLIKDDSGVTTIATVTPGTAQMIVPVGGLTWVALGATIQKASAAEVVTGTDDVKYTTPKSIKDAGILPGGGSGADPLTVQFFN